MADCAQAIQSIGTYEFVIRGNVTTEAEFNSQVEWVVGKDSNDTAIMGAKPEKKINEEARAYLASTDWMSVREAEGGTAMPSDVKTKRAAERAKVVDYANFSG